jgi:hypothetical protein
MLLQSRDGQGGFRYIFTVSYMKCSFRRLSGENVEEMVYLVFVLHRHLHLAVRTTNWNIRLQRVRGIPVLPCAAPVSIPTYYSGSV